MIYIERLTDSFGRVRWALYENSQAHRPIALIESQNMKLLVDDYQRLEADTAEPREPWKPNK